MGRARIAIDHPRLRFRPPQLNPSFCGGCSAFRAAHQARPLCRVGFDTVSRWLLLVALPPRRGTRILEVSYDRVPFVRRGCSCRRGIFMSQSEKGGCPGCTRPDPREMTTAQEKRIPPQVRDAVNATPGRSMICGYCGCVYKINVPPTMFGYLDNPLKGKGWVPT